MNELKMRIPDSIRITGEGATILSCKDASLRLEQKRNCISVFIKCPQKPLSLIDLKWTLAESELPSEPIKVLGDSWERGYGDLEWREPDETRPMPWYFLISNGSDSLRDFRHRVTLAFGVAVRPNALCLWHFGNNTVSLTLDVRAGGDGLLLGERELYVCDILFRSYRGISAFEAASRFCSAMSPSPRRPSAPVYGFNNWYYAYGKSSHAEILDDARALADLTRECKARPYMVIDAGWQIVDYDGPWDQGNERFPDMSALAREISALDVLPGIWVRPLMQSKNEVLTLPDDWYLDPAEPYLDPSREDVLDHIAGIFSRLSAWGYRLIKFDFLTYDVFRKWCFAETELPADDSLHFSDRSRTSAEIIKTLFDRIREASGDAVLIGCNVIGHLAAGVVELNRTGDDTSGREWARTRRMGVNTLAFHLPQHRTFYDADADCVGLTANVPWELNQRWLDILAVSGSPLFISWDRSFHTPEIEQSVARGFLRNAAQNDQLIPIDWMETKLPEHWELNGETINYTWDLPEGTSSLSAEQNAR